MKVIKDLRKVGISIVSILFVAMLTGCISTINTNHNDKFDENGYLKTDSTISEFQMQQPSLMKFYVEVSGSMNGFFRSNKATFFKTDFWDILNYYSSISAPITILTNSGSQGAHFQLQDFRNKMNTGAFISSASTKVPIMLQTIINNLNTEKGEVAVLVSDMKYSPVGAAAPTVLMTQYSTDVSRILGDFNNAMCLICATSNYFGSRALCQDSPYYYLILGKAENVAFVRNTISSLLSLEKQGASGNIIKSRFIDNIETGFDYGKPKYSFGISNKCNQAYETEPTFTGYEEIEDGDTCMIRLKVNLEDYRWIISNKDRFLSSFKVKTLYGSKVEVGKIKMEVSNITGEKHELKRKATAMIDLKIFNMPTESDVIEWRLEIPHTDYTLFNRYFENATDENDPSKSYSVLDFVKGMFQGGIISQDLKSNYILISKKG